jgi:hypothetical protein
MVDWDWESNPTYESERIRIDAASSPAALYDMRLPRQVKDYEVGLMLSLADFHLERGLPFVGLVRHERGTGVITARHRKAFADWLEERRDALKRDDFGVVVVIPEAIFRAVLRVVYRFRTPPLRTLTTPDVPSATEAVRAELVRMGQAVTPQIEAFLQSLAA